ncbi:MULTISPECIES: XRE family transcriptional regulator [unclassified Spirosoma]|uniref:XRE family transcriptional regulator n=1 Tax=unclassified Spirosoma TaxID=2621999 RepID=UPI00095FC75E|nr:MULTISPECIES: XRE family transcriptional regulator [unclassified Spirosoma]MBN8824406.1 helix-turn-helix domain-containing protein [Spirosoma sp.]OJW70132.1 MAG: hypothetical protein BGO59_26010 [Spirosoma sp. 48-14]
MPILSQQNQTLALTPMTTNEKIAAIRDLTGLNQNRFSKLIGVAPSTMTRLERGSPNKPSHDTLQKIADHFAEVTLDWLTDEDDDTLPKTITLKPGSSIESLSSPDHEGQRFRRFVERHKPKLNQNIIAESIGVSRNQVGAYYNTIRFRQSVQSALLEGLSKLLGRPVSPEEVFGAGRNAGTNVPTNLIAVPKLSVTDRPKLSTQFLGNLQANFMPAVQMDKVMYAPKQAVTEENFKRAFAIEIAAGDRMEPLYFPGYWVLGINLEPADYSKLYDGTVAVMTNDGQFLVKKIVANNIRTTGVLELGSYIAGSGGSVQLRKSDISLMFSIAGIIFGLTA